MKYFNLESTTSVYGQDVLITILPKHAERLYAGKKLFELRKVIPKDIPRRIFLYETENVSSITGHIVIERVLTGSPEEIWARTGTSATTKNRFFDYFSDRPIANAFEVSRAIRYRQPIPLREIVGIEPGFRAPQNFLYLRNLPKLHSVLLEKLIKTVFPFTFEDIQLRPILEPSKDRFLKAVDKHITGSYLETAREYGNKLLSIHDQGTDTEGVITLSKVVLEVRIGTGLAGFIVLTEKGGGSLKTGPTILLDKYRHRGYGKQMRRAIHELAHTLAHRKVYCTVPANNFDALSYLIASGYRLEAHLRRHYHDEHDELVFGYNLTHYRAPSPDFVRQISPLSDFSRLERIDTEVIQHIQTEFESLYCLMPEQWAQNQVREAVANTRAKASSFKPRSIYTGRGLDLGAVALCLHKRGGSVKIILLTRTSHTKSITRLLMYIQRSLQSSKKLKARKLYAHLPLGDSDLIQSFYDAGFSIEGILERPYNDHIDMVVLGKLMSQAN